MNRGSSRYFPRHSNDSEEPGWYETQNDHRYVRYWTGNQWDNISYEKGVNWWMGILSFVLWWAPLGVVAYGLVSRTNYFFPIVLVVVLCLWILFVAWALHQPIRRTIWQTFKCMVPLTF